MKRALTFFAALALVFSCDSVDPEMLQSAMTNMEQTSIASIQNQLTQFQSSLELLQNTQDQLSSYVSQLQEQVNSIDGNYNSLNSLVQSLQAQSEQFGKDIAALSASIESNAADIKKWVEESYATLEAFNALQQQVTDISTSISGIVSRLDSLDEQTKKISADLEAATTALTTDLGKCQEDIAALQSALQKLQEDLDDVKTQISALVSAVQSVVVVPDYDDGSVMISPSSENQLRFEVYPLSAAQNLATLGASALSLDFVETHTKSGLFTNIPVTAVSFDGEVLLVTADGSGLPDNFREGSYSARIRISDGTVTRSSEFFPMTYRFIELLPASEITEYSAVLNARVYTHDSFDSNASYGFFFSDSLRILSQSVLDISVDVGKGLAKTNTLSADGLFSCSAYYGEHYDYDADEWIPNNLHSGTTYYYRAFVNDNGRYYFSTMDSFTTLGIDASIEVSEVTGLTGTKATLNGKLLIDNENKEQLSKRVEFHYGKYDSVEGIDEYGSYRQAELNDDGSFSFELRRLSPNTAYYYYACAYINDVYLRSELFSFTTTDIISDITIDGEFSDWSMVNCSEAIVPEQPEYPYLQRMKAIAMDDVLYLYFEYLIKEGQDQAPFDIFINSDGNRYSGCSCWLWNSAGLEYFIESENGFLNQGEFSSSVTARLYECIDLSGNQNYLWDNGTSIEECGQIGSFSIKGIIQDGVAIAELSVPLYVINALYSNASEIGLVVYSIGDWWQEEGVLPQGDNEKVNLLRILL